MGVFNGKVLGECVNQTSQRNLTDVSTGAPTLARPGYRGGAAERGEVQEETSFKTVTWTG